MCACTVRGGTGVCGLECVRVGVCEAGCWWRCAAGDAPPPPPAMRRRRRRRCAAGEALRVHGGVCAKPSQSVSGKSTVRFSMRSISSSTADSIWPMALATIMSIICCSMILSACVGLRARAGRLSGEGATQRQNLRRFFSSCRGGAFRAIPLYGNTASAVGKNNSASVFLVPFNVRPRASLLAGSLVDGGAQGGGALVEEAHRRGHGS